MRPLFLIPLLLATLPAPAEAASFNCRLAKAPVEIVICREPEISGLDEEMSELFFTLTGRAPPVTASAIRTEQTAWLRQRDACGNNAACVLAAYQRRVDRLLDWRTELGLVPGYEGSPTAGAAAEPVPSDGYGGPSMPRPRLGR